jgi:2-keto-3-deoxy-L-rhamnonate aldolase RhmA
MMAAGTPRDVAATTNHALIGMWLCAARPIAAEICGARGADWLLIDGEHGANPMNIEGHG